MFVPNFANLFTRQLRKSVLLYAVFSIMTLTYQTIMPSKNTILYKIQLNNNHPEMPADPCLAKMDMSVCCI